MGLSGVTLAMDAAAGNGTIAVLRDGAVVADADVVMRSAAEERFFPAVLATLETAGVGIADVTRIVVGAGPGSFTALRVAGAIAKGLAQGRGIPLCAVPSLALVAPPSAPRLSATQASDVPGAPAPTRWLVTLDALRGERYAALVERDAEGQVRRVEQLGLLAIADVLTKAQALDAQAIGPDEALAASPQAREVARCAALIDSLGPVDLARWEPMYGRLAEAQVKWEAAHGRPLS